MPTRNVVLTDHQSRLIDELIESGRYQKAIEVLREGLRLIEERRAVETAKLDALRAAARVGVEDFETGNFKVFENGKALSTHLDKLSAGAFARKKAR